MAQSNIRNFAIVAHIDHGKSTLADRLLETTGTIEKRHMMEQVLDSNPIERERGITISLAPVRMEYKFSILNSQFSNNDQNSKNEPTTYNLQPTTNNYILNLIDTPGHVDFSYEVSRSLAACEGVILVVDATQGIQAQTLAHMQLITEKNLAVVPIINKIDLPTARVREVANTLRETFHFNSEDIISISAKNGINIDAVFQAVITKIPPPAGESEANLQALVFSSQYDAHRGVIVYVRIVNGQLSQSQHKMLRFVASGVTFQSVELGLFHPDMQPVGELFCGEVGYIATGLKDLSLARVGDTIVWEDTKALALPGYREPKPMVYVSIFPTDANDFLILRESLEKLHLSDGSFTYTPRSSAALGKGFLCGFLGLLHADVVRERIAREFGLNVIATSPTVEYEIQETTGETTRITTPEDFPDPSRIREIREPTMFASIFSPKEYVGGIMQLCETHRAQFVNLEYIGNQAVFTYIIPLSEMIVDFFDSLKSISSGYASLDYELYEYRSVDAVKLAIFLNHKIVDAFSQIVVRDRAEMVARIFVEKLKEHIPRHQFQIPIQAAIGAKVIARADVKSFRKDVTKKLNGGDRTRKDKLLEAQKKGKKRMRSFGNVEIPQEVFLEVYKN